MEERPGHEVEAGLVGAEDLGAGHVGGHQVGGALDAGEAGVEAGGQRLDGAGLGEAGRAFDEQMTAGEHADGKALDEALVADEPGRDGRGQSRDGRKRIGDPRVLKRHAVLPIDRTGREWHGARGGGYGARGQTLGGGGEAPGRGGGEGSGEPAVARARRGSSC